MNVARPAPEQCPGCGYDELYCRCDDEDFMGDLACTWCGGDGDVWGSELGDPLWYLPDHLYPCSACNGSGRRKDQWLF